MSKFERHPLSAAFPGMDQKDYSELVDDVAAHGLIQPVVTFEGMVLDGWHRYQACLDAGVKPRFEAFKGSDPVAYVLSLNMHRRHLTGSQRAAAVVACHAWAPSGTNQVNARTVEPGSTVATASEMAEEAGVSPKTIQQAKRAQEVGLGEAVRDGLVTAKRAAEVAKLPEPERQAALEAPPAPKPAPPISVKDLEPVRKALSEAQARIAELEAENAKLLEEKAEALALLDELKLDLDAASRTLDAENLLEQFQKEIHRAHALATATQSRNNGLMNHNKALARDVKRWMEKAARLEKKATGEAVEPEPEPVPAPPMDDDPDWFAREEGA